MAGDTRIELVLRDSKSPVLPLHKSPTNYTYFLKNMIDFSTEEPSVTEVDASVNTFVVLEQQKFQIVWPNFYLAKLLHYKHVFCGDNLHTQPHTFPIL